MNVQTQRDDALATDVREWMLEFLGEGLTVKEAARRVGKYRPDAKRVISSIEIELDGRQRQFNTFSAKIILGDAPRGPRWTPWYLGPRQNGNWARYRALLESQGAPGLANLDDETNRVVWALASPRRRGDRRKGLVMGNVQSGKTRNFAGVIAKASDAGYKMIIVLSGIHNNLREQTQSRLSAQVFGDSGWYPLTTDESDFEIPNRPEELFVHQPAICMVVKKNVTRLRKLVRMMKSVPLDVRKRTPILIVDDEADQATPNSRAAQNKFSAINRSLRDLWQTVEVGSYVAYTATPFANILMDPDDEEGLFPSDFVTTLDPGPGYFGPKKVFGISDTISGDGIDRNPGLDMVRSIPSSDADVLRPPSDRVAREAFDPKIPGSLADAIRWFVVATAIRRARKQSGHSSMLVHTTHYASPHFALARRIKEFVRSLNNDATSLNDGAFKSLWLREARRVSEEASVSLPSWEDTETKIPQVLDEVKVIIDNGRSDDRLNYETDSPQTVIAVGGGTLSRGLTLEGLVVSYFTRTSNTYDTLMQMGRWFGYRAGYEDLPRVWVTDGLRDDYAFLARVEMELRDVISEMKDSEYSPAETGLRVRSHPGRLEITAKNKMTYASIAQLGLSGTANQTFLLDGSTKKVVDDNVQAVGALVAGRQLAPIPDTGRYLATGVEGMRVCQFLRSFHVNEDQRWLTDPELNRRTCEWVSRWAPGATWNVVLAGNRPSSRLRMTGDHPGTIWVAGIELTCLDRTPLDESTAAKIDYKAVMSASDRVADIPTATLGAVREKSHTAYRRLRRKLAPDRGLIVVYPLSSRSIPAPENEDRMSVPTDFPLLAFSIFFPYVNDERGLEGAFVSVRPNWVVPEVIEGDDDLEFEEE